MKTYAHPDLLGAQRIIRPASTDLALSALVSGDTYSRWTLDAAGKMSWGRGTADVDLFADRYEDGGGYKWLQVNPGLRVAGRLTAGAAAFAVDATGVVIAGTWNGSAIGAIYGGTGQTTVTAGDLLYGAAGGSAWNRLAKGTDGQILTLVSGLPAWAAAAGGVSYATPAGTPVGLTNSAGSASSVWRSDCTLALDQAIAPTWTGVHAWTKATANPFLTAKVAGDTYNRFTLHSTGKMSWGRGTADLDLFADRYEDGGGDKWLRVDPNLRVAGRLTAGNSAFAVDASGVVTAGTWNGTAIGAIYGGTGQTAVTAGDLLYGSATNTWNRLAKGASPDGYVLTLASGAPAWAAAGAGSSLWTQVAAGGGVPKHIKPTDADEDVRIIPRTSPTVAGRLIISNASTDQIFDLENPALWWLRLTGNLHVADDDGDDDDLNGNLYVDRAFDAGNGQFHVTRGGCVTLGAWQSTIEIAPQYGGTGTKTTPSTGSVLVCKSTTVPNWTPLAIGTVGQRLTVVDIGSGVLEARWA
jgi:hypothetical protein